MAKGKWYDLDFIQGMAYESERGAEVLEVVLSLTHEFEKGRLRMKKQANYRGGVWWPDVGEAIGGEAIIDVVIPALNEEESLPLVLKELPWEVIRRVVVVDNGSTDRTGEVASAAGAQVVEEPQRGYGAACLKGLSVLREDPPEIVVFLDADFSDEPQDLLRVIAPILAGDAQMVIGSRMLGGAEPGALLPQAQVGNRFACLVMWLLYGYQYSDLGPFRGITWEALERLGMADETYGWTVEMQLKAARQRMSVVEVPVSYRKRVGVSKITGTVKGTVLASYKILATLGRHSLDVLKEPRGGA